MRVVSVSIPYPRPEHRFDGLFVHRRLSALAERVDLRMISPRPWFPGLRPRPANAPGVEDGVTVSRPRMFYLPGALKGLDGFWLRRCLLGEIGRLRRERPIDLVDAHFEYPEAVGAVGAARALGLPVFVTLRGLLPKYLATAARREQCLGALREATGVISVAHSLKQLAEENGIDGAKIRVIPNAIDARTFAPGPREAARAELGVDPAAPLIVTVGALEARKGQHLMVRALARIKSQRGPVRLIVVGNERFDPAYTREVVREIAESGVGAEVELVGQQAPARVAAWLRAADVFALPTANEGCCNAVLEALACGTPVVTTAVGDNTHYVDEARGAILPQRDVPALTSALSEALDRDWDRPAIAQAVAGRTWGHVADEVLDFFHERLGSRTAAAARS